MNGAKVDYGFGKNLNFKPTKFGYEADLIKGLDFDFSMVEVIRKLREVAFILSRDFVSHHPSLYVSSSTVLLLMSRIINI